MKGLIYTLLVIFGTVGYGEIWYQLFGASFAGAITVSTGYVVCALLMWWAVERGIEL